MLRLKDVPPDEMSEVLRVASELYARDERAAAQAEERRHLVAAAEEVGLPEEYLERAAAEVHERRVARIRQVRQRRNLGLGVGAVALAVGAFVLTRPSPSVLPPPTPVVAPPVMDTFDAGPSRWVLNKDPQTRASLSFPTESGQGRHALLRVQSFGSGAGTEQFFANVDLAEGALSLTGKREVSFKARGKGLERVRVDLQNGPLERWRSRVFPLTGGWRDAQIPLDTFERQTRTSPTGRWQVQSFRPPETVQRISFKVGYFINDRAAQGEVALDDLRVE